MPRNRSTIPILVARIQARLYKELGGQCSLHNQQDIYGECDGPLEIDHPYGRDWIIRRANIYNRWLRYQREHEQGLVRLLCRYHNETVRPNRAAAPAHGADLAQPF